MAREAGEILGAAARDAFDRAGKQPTGQQVEKLAEDAWMVYQTTTGREGDLQEEIEFVDGFYTRMDPEGSGE